MSERSLTRAEAAEAQRVAERDRILAGGMPPSTMRGVANGLTPTRQEQNRLARRAAWLAAHPEDGD